MTSLEFRQGSRATSNRLANPRALSSLLPSLILQGTPIHHHGSHEIQSRLIVLQRIPLYHLNLKGSRKAGSQKYRSAPKRDK